MFSKLSTFFRGSRLYPFLKKSKYYPLLREYFLYYRFIQFVSPKKDTWYFLLNWYATGDVYILCSLLHAFKKEHKAEKITLLTWSNKHAEIISLFNVDVEVKIYPTPFPKLGNFLQFKKGAIINLHHFYYMKGIRRLMGYKDVTLFDVFKLLLDVPLTSQPESPTFIRTPDKIQFVENLFTKSGLRKGRTIILAPEATTIKEVDINFWKQLIKKFESLNYDVVLSAYKKHYLNSLEIPVINFSHKYAVAAVDYAGYFVSLRSGICDIISESTSTKIILYPKVQWFGGDLIKGASLKQLSPKNNDVLFELEYANEEVESLIHQIVDIVQRHEVNRGLPAGV